jgi:hypothetical protein
MAKPTNYERLFTKIDSEAEAFRRKRMAEALKPLRIKRDDLAKQLQTIDALLGKITDTPITTTKRTRRTTSHAKPRKGKRVVLSADARLTLAQKIYDHLKAKGEKIKPKELEKMTKVQGRVVKARELVKLWNDKNKDRKIKRSGEKALATYFV